MRFNSIENHINKLNLIKSKEKPKVIKAQTSSKSNEYYQNPSIKAKI